VARYRLTARVGPDVRREKHDSLDAAIASLRSRIGDVGRAPGRQVLGRDYAPGAQVAGRFEVRGPGGVRGGVDVRGDGSAEAYRGWVRKQVVEREPGESAVDALQRALAAG
jgi:hypothetical protein